MTYKHIGDAERTSLLLSAPHGTKLFPTGDWMIIPSQTEIVAECSVLGFLSLSARLSVLKGSVDVDDRGEIRRFEVVAGTGSVDTGGDRRDEYVCGPALLDAERYPVIRYAGRGSRERINGVLTVKNEESTMTLTATRASVTEDGRASFAAEGTLDRRLVGLGQLPGAVVGSLLTVRVSGRAYRR